MLRFFFLLLAALSAAAQTTTGTIVGTVKDSSGAGISGARIHVTNEGAGIAAAATSNASGDFVVPNLTASTYSLLVESQGMRPAALTGIQLLVKETYRADVRMEPGALQQSITVTAQSGEVNADTSSVYAVDSIPARHFGVALQCVWPAARADSSGWSGNPQRMGRALASGAASTGTPPFAFLRCYGPRSHAFPHRHRTLGKAAERIILCETLFENYLMIRLPILFAGAVSLCAQSPDWVLANFAQRLEIEITNPSAKPIDTLAVIPVQQAALVAPHFPGTLAIVVLPGNPIVTLPSQADDLDGDGIPDEFVFPAKLAAGESRKVHIYYSTTLTDPIPWPSRVHASHAFGFNRATVALESEVIGYRTYGGFFLDIQARSEGQPGLNNGLVGYLGARHPVTIGRDIIHLGDTLGLGGLFLRSGNDVYRPPLNMPDYAHKPETPDAPRYRVIATGPVRAMVEARIEHWKLGADEVDLQAFYSIAAGAGSVECRFQFKPIRLGGTYEVGTGIRQLPQMATNHAAGRLALSGLQAAEIGSIGLALYYDAAAAARVEPLVTRGEKNETIVFHGRLQPGLAFSGRYWLAGAWSGSGIRDLLGYLAAEGDRARSGVTVGGYRFSKTPNPERVEGEAF